MNLEKFLPLTETTYYILLSLQQPMHGYGIMQNVEALSQGAVKIAAGTLYGALENLSKQRLICPIEGTEAGRRKTYQLTELGKSVLRLEYNRMARLVAISQQIIGG